MKKVKYYPHRKAFFIKKTFLLIILISAHLFFLQNTLFTLWPEMVVYPYLLNNGFILYTDIINPYPPVLTFFLAQFASVFGYSPLPYQILTWGVIIIIDAAVFTFSFKISKNLLQSLISTLFFIVLSIPFGINGLWFELVQTPLLLISLLFYMRFIKQSHTNDLFLSILLLTIAIFIKQHAVWLGIWYLLYMIFIEKDKLLPVFKKSIFLALPALLIGAVHLIFFIKAGNLSDFIYWNIQFPLFETLRSPGYLLLPNSRNIIVIIALFIFFAPIIINKNPAFRLIILTALVLLLFAYPRFDYFHLIPALAVISTLAGQVVREFSKSRLKSKSLFLLSFFLLTLFFTKHLINNWTTNVRFFESEILSSARFLEMVTPEKSRIYIQNGPDQILPLSNRLPTKPWATQFPWYLENEDVQERVMSGIFTQNPKYIVQKPYLSGEPYDLGVYRPKKIAEHIDENYQDFFQISDSLWLKVRK